MKPGPKHRLPNKEEIEGMIRFLPEFSHEGFKPDKGWVCMDEAGKLVFPHPIYEPVVEDFIREACRACWIDYEYVGNKAAEKIRDFKGIANASLEEIRSMITFCIRGERFSDGHIGAMIREGKIPALLRRLAELLKEGKGPGGEKGP